MAQGEWDTGTWDAALWDSLPVTGNTGTGSAGTLGVSAGEAITGVSATAAAGTESPSITVAISGVQATGSVGSEGETITLTLSGNGATGAAGNVSLSFISALIGTEAIGSAGTVIAVVPPIIIIDDTHDGDYKKKKYADERATKERRKAELVDLYERIVEGRPEVAEKIVAPFVKTKAQGQQTAPLVRQIDFDKLMRDITKVEALYKEHLAMDDEEVLSLL
jgi:hypothetical protein